MEYVLEMKDISKTFPGVKALDHVQLQVKPGEVHALMGENGAGKSTLMKILMGIYTKDNGGEIIFNGQPYHVSNPKEAMDHGVAMIHQELNPILDMSVYENIFVGREIRKNGLEKEVKIYPNVPYEKMWEIYEMSDYYLNMNKGEIFGMAIMEAVYYKTSVAAIRALGPSVTLKDMKGHKLCENDDEMAEWITGPYPSEKDLQESSEKMASTFTWDRCADAFLQASSEKSSR